MGRRGGGRDEEEGRRGGGAAEVLRGCCGKLPGWLTADTTETFKQSTQVAGNGEWNVEMTEGNGGRRRRQVAGRQVATGGDRRRPSSPPALPGGAPGRRGGARPPAHAEHAGIRRYGARRCNGGGIRCFAISQFVFNSSIGWLLKKIRSKKYPLFLSMLPK